MDRQTERGPYMDGVLQVGMPAASQSQAKGRKVRTMMMFMQESETLQKQGRKVSFGFSSCVTVPPLITMIFIVRLVVQKVLHSRASGEMHIWHPSIVL